MEEGLPFDAADIAHERHQLEVLFERAADVGARLEVVEAQLGARQSAQTVDPARGERALAAERRETGDDLLAVEEAEHVADGKLLVRHVAASCEVFWRRRRVSFPAGGVR